MKIGQKNMATKHEGFKCTCIAAESISTKEIARKSQSGKKKRRPRVSITT
jgi:hypothetical protein